MKAVILAGGLGTRLSEETQLRPKPMVEIAGRPILWHIMKLYAHHGVHEFIVCCGYKAYMIKEYFANYFLHNSDVTFDLRSNEMKIDTSAAEPWKVTLVDTGEQTQTGGRLKRVYDHIKDEREFCFTYGDGLTDLNIAKTIEYHRAHGKMATVTAVQPPGRFGALQLEGDSVAAFTEKPKGDGAYINGGFFVLSPRVVQHIEKDETIWEKEPMESLAKSGQMKAYLHNGFWQAMDTLRDKNHLEELWKTGRAPWKLWT